MKKFFLRKIKEISGLLIILIVIMAIGCGKPVTEASPTEDSEEITTTEETIEETTEETTEEVAEESEETTEKTREEVIEETPEPEKYFTYKPKYVEEYPWALLITDESFPEDLRVSLSDDLPESFFEEIDCKTSEECFNQVIQGILDSLEGKEIILRDTQRGIPKFCYVDTTKPVEIVFKFVSAEDQETGPLHLPWGEGIPYSSLVFVKTPDKALRFIAYQSPKALEDMLNIPGERYGVSADLNWMATILKFHPEILGWDQINPTKIESSPEEENFLRKIHLLWQEYLEYVEERDEYVQKQEFQGILLLKGER